MDGKVSKSRGVVVLVATRILTMLAQLVAIRVYLWAIGTELNGAVLFVAGCSAYAALADPGFVEGGIVHLLRSASSKSDLNPWDVWRTHLRMASLLGALGAALLFMIGFVVHAVPNASMNLWMFGLAGLWYAVTAVQTATMHYLTATQQYSRLARLSAVAVLLGHVASGVLVGITKSPPLYFVGLLIGALVSTSAMLRVAKQSEQRSGHAGHFDPRLAREFIKIGKRSYANRALSLIAGNADRILLGGAISKNALTQYSNSIQLTIGMNELTGTIRQTFQADLAHAYLSGPHEFAASVDRFSRLSLAVAICFILIPSAFGAALLSLWLGDKMYSGGAVIMLGIAVYRCFEMYFSCHGLAMTAAARPQLMFPPILWNAICTLALTVPAVKMFNIEGIAFMNVAINVILFLPLLYFIKRKLLPELHMRQHVTKVALMLFIGFGVGLGIHFLCRTELLTHFPIVSLPLIFISCALVAGIIFALDLAPCPESITRRVGMRSPRLAAILMPRYVHGTGEGK